MSRRKQSSGPSNKLGGSNQTDVCIRTKPAHRSTFEPLQVTMESIGWTENAVVTGVNFKQLEDCWLAVIKADFSDGPRVAFQRGPTLALVVRAMEHNAERGGLFWRVDDWEVTARRQKRSHQPQS